MSMNQGYYPERVGRFFKPALDINPGTCMRRLLFDVVLMDATFNGFM